MSFIALKAGEAKKSEKCFKNVKILIWHIQNSQSYDNSYNVFETDKKNYKRNWKISIRTFKYTCKFHPAYSMKYRVWSLLEIWD